MKNRKKYLALFVLAMVAAMIVGCKKSDEVEVRELNPDTDWEILEAIAMSEDEGIPFPQGSKVKKDKNNTFYITLPEGYYYLVAPIGERGPNEPVETPIIGVNCNCTDGTGCDPSANDGKFYCVMKSSCFSCNRTNIYENQRGESFEVEILGLLNRNVGISLLCDKNVVTPDDDFPKPYIKGTEVIHGNAFEALFDVEEVRLEFEMWGKMFEKAGVKPNTLAFMNIFGNVALIPFYLEEEQGYYMYDGIEYFAKTAPIETGNEYPYICRCESGNNGCKIEKQYINILIGWGYRCISNGCSSCTMLSTPQR